jgi:hypothetical protein
MLSYLIIFVSSFIFLVGCLSRCIFTNKGLEACNCAGRSVLKGHTNLLYFRLTLMVYSYKYVDSSFRPVLVRLFHTTNNHSTILHYASAYISIWISRIVWSVRLNLSLYLDFPWTWATRRTPYRTGVRELWAVILQFILANQIPNKLCFSILTTMYQFSSNKRDMLPIAASLVLSDCLWENQYHTMAQIEVQNLVRLKILSGWNST